MKRCLFVLGLALVFAVSARADDPPGGKDLPVIKPSKVPFSMLSTQHIYLKVKVNGEGPFNLIFDTGAPFSLVSNRLAKAANVIPKDHKGPTLPLFGATPSFKMKTFEVGELKATDLPVMVMDHPTVKAISKAMEPTLGAPIDGIIGLSFFGRYKVTIDYQAKEMTFSPSTFVPSDAMTKMMAAMTGPKNPPRKILAPAAQWGFRVTKDEKDEEAGVEVKEVLAGSPAADAGLKAGDRLLTLDGRWTDSVADCYAAAGYVQPGEIARLLVKRAGKEVALTVKVQAGL